MKAKVISNYSLCTLAILNICTMTCVCCMQYTGKIYTDFFWWNLYMYIQIHRYIQTSFDNIRTHNKNMYCISLVHVEDRMPIYELLKPEDMKAVRLLLRTFQLQLAWSSPVRKPWKHCAALGFDEFPARAVTCMMIATPSILPDSFIQCFPVAVQGFVVCGLVFLWVFASPIPSINTKDKKALKKV